MKILSKAEHICSWVLSSVHANAQISIFQNSQLVVRLACDMQVVSQLKAADCEEVEMLLDSKCFSFRSTKSKSMMNQTEVTLYSEAGGGKLCLYAESDAEIRAAFAFRNFQRVGHLCRAGCKVLLQMGDDAPLSVVCDLVHGGACQLLAALLE